MPTKNNAIKINHELAEIKVIPHGDINRNKLKQLICMALNSYIDKDNIPANKVHADAKKRHGKNYQTPGYYLRLYRLRVDLTQAQLAENVSILQHHLSEMENNKRPIGKKCAMKLAVILKIDYHQLL
ncbi:MAG: helix-turn-helix transcriptional regulator [Coxiellaceae bacterium]|nr:helix-turn-helix transcriptional regulator [Coxiellaceae bacterium]